MQGMLLLLFPSQHPGPQVLALVRTFSSGDTFSCIFLLTEALGKLIQGHIWGLHGAELNPGLLGHKELSPGFMTLPVVW